MLGQAKPAQVTLEKRYLRRQKNAVATGSGAVGVTRQKALAPGPVVLEIACDQFRYNSFEPDIEQVLWNNARLGLHLHVNRKVVALAHGLPAQDLDLFGGQLPQLIQGAPAGEIIPDAAIQSLQNAKEGRTPPISGSNCGYGHASLLFVNEHLCVFCLRYTPNKYLAQGFSGN
jgi:hypothetical protein